MWVIGLLDLETVCEWYGYPSNRTGDSIISARIPQEARKHTGVWWTKSFLGPLVIGVTSCEETPLAWSYTSRRFLDGSIVWTLVDAPSILLHTASAKKPISNPPWGMRWSQKCITLKVYVSSWFETYSSVNIINWRLDLPSIYIKCAEHRKATYRSE